MVADSGLQPNLLVHNFGASSTMVADSGLHLGGDAFGEDHHVVSTTEAIGEQAARNQEDLGVAT